MPGNRDRALGLAVAAGLVAIIAAALLAGGPEAPRGAPSPVVLPTTPSSGMTQPSSGMTRSPEQARLDWYDSSASLRASLASTVAGVRRWIESNDGRALEPACADLATLAARARAHPAAPDPATQRVWAAGVSSYTNAATSCGQLFDGTRIEVGVLLERTTKALDQADAAWAELARLPLPPGNPGTRVSGGATKP
jgi:hypothetical protein